MRYWLDTTESELTTLGLSNKLYRGADIPDPQSSRLLVLARYKTETDYCLSDDGAEADLAILEGLGLTSITEQEAKDLASFWYSPTILPFIFGRGYELPPQLTANSFARTLMLLQRQQYSVGSAEVDATDGNTIKNVDDVNDFSVSGILVDEIPGDTLAFDYDEYGITLNDPEDGPTLLAIANIITDLDDDNLSDLIDSEASILVIGDELMAVGLAIESNGDYSIKYLLRGLYGTTPSTHAAATPFFWVAAKAFFLNESFVVPYNVLTNVDLNAYPIIFGQRGPGATFPIQHEGANNGLLLNEGLRPLAPTLWSVENIGLTYEIALNPVLADGGAGITEIPTATLNQSFVYIEYTGGVPGAEIDLDGSFIPATNSDADTGVFDSIIDITPGTDQIYIYAVKNNLKSLEVLKLNIT